MSEFATLAAPYSMLAATHGDVDLTDEAKTRSRALNQFLAGVELKAFKIAQMALRHEDDALDAVQDAMLQLARAYADRPASEWKPLFYRIHGNHRHVLSFPTRRCCDYEVPLGSTIPAYYGL